MSWPRLCSVNWRFSSSRLGYSGLLLLTGLLLWTAATWPLPRVFSVAIPHTHLHSGPQTVRPIVAGAHLQWLCRFGRTLEMLSGRSFVVHDDHGFTPGSGLRQCQAALHGLPAALVFAAIAPWAGPAAGWNAAGLASVLLGVWALGFLARRFTSAPTAVLLATLVAAALPFFWIMLFRGSPAGFAMAFPPLLFYGLDRAIRDHSPWGGLLAGLALFLAGTTDWHVFFFSMLAAPVFIILSFAMSAPAPRKRPGAIRHTALFILVFVFLALSAVAFCLRTGHPLVDAGLANPTHADMPLPAHPAANISCLLPALFAPLLAPAFSSLLRPRRRVFLRFASTLCVSLFALGTVLHALAQTDPGFCRLPRESAAYAAVAGDDTANAGKPACALALPLRPGDTHWVSLYEYHGLLSSVRLVNGDAPADNREDILNKYESLNQGYATDEQLDGLLALGVRHLILHANSIPEPAAPFPAAATLRALVGHPRLALIADDGLVFAFRILSKYAIGHVPHANWTDTLHAVSRHWHWNPPLEIPPAQDAPLLLHAPVFPAPNLRYLLRLGTGSAQPLLVPSGREGIARLTQPVAGFPDWLQSELPSPTGAWVNALSGPVVLEQVLLTAGDLPARGPDGSIRIRPALLFHCGHSAPGQDFVSLDPETVPAGVVLHGPNLPFPPGVYDVVLSYSARGRSPPGVFRVLSLPGSDLLAQGNLDPATNRLILPAVTLEAAPIRFEFSYNGDQPVDLREIRLVPATLRLVPVP